jgi:sulfonate transport system permease protein
MRHAPPGSRRARRLIAGGGIGLVVPVLLLAVWETVSRTGLAPRNILPAPSAVFGTLWALAASGELWGDIGITLFRVAMGFLVGTAVATVLGALTGYSQTWRRLLDPMLKALGTIPSMAWIPLFVLWLGIFEASKVTLIAIGAFFPVYLNLMAGIQQVDRKLVEVARVHGLTGLSLVRRVLLPATLPFYITGMRAGMALAWMFVVAAEFMGASEGLGFLLIDGQETGRPANIIAAILLFALFGKLSDMVLAAIGRHFVAWQDTHQAAAEKNENARDRGPLQAVR